MAVLMARRLVGVVVIALVLRESRRAAALARCACCAGWAAGPQGRRGGTADRTGRRLAKH